MGVDILSLAKRYLTEIWGKGNTAVIDEVVDDNISLEDPMSTEPAKGKNVVKERVGMMSQQFTDVTITIKEAFASGDVVAIRHQWAGKHTGDFFGIKPTNKRITCDTVEIIKVRNGKVVENISYFDVYTMFQQLGALPPPDKLKPQQAEPASQTARA